MELLNTMDQADVNIDGVCDSEFSLVRSAFANNFLEGDELGAAVCVFKEGKKVVDLWGGHCDRDKTRPWEQDTIVCMMSVAKSIVALAVHMLIDRGQIDLNAPVSTYWPEFGQAGKANITVKLLLAGRAGLLYADHAPVGALFDFATMVDALAKQPAELPEKGHGAYHSMTIGFLLGELVRRVDGRSVDQFVAEEICGPLSADYQYGVADKDMSRVTLMTPNPVNATFNAFADPNTKLHRAWRVTPEGDTPFFNRTEFLQGLVPSGNGVGNARSVARIYAALAQGGELDGVRLVGPDAVEIMRELQWDNHCGMTNRHYRYGLGFFLNQKPLTPMGPNPRAFGHMGAGGAIGFADPEVGLSFSYSPNFMCASEGVGSRCRALIEAVSKSYF